MRAQRQEPSEHLRREYFVSCQRVVRRTDTGNRGGRALPKVDGSLLPSFFYAEGGVESLGFHHAEKGREGYDVDGRTQQGHFSRQLFQNSGQEIRLQVIVAADFQGNIVFVSSRPLSG